MQRVPSEFHCTVRSVQCVCSMVVVDSVAG